MSPRPLVFISAVSRELRTARQLVANTLTFLGYEPVWQDIFGTEEGDLREMLREQIDQCAGLVQLVGRCYGAEPPSPDPQFGRVSYTQYEALYARQQGKKVWYLFIDETFPVDGCEAEPEELRALQAAYRKKLQGDSHVFHPLQSTEALESSVLKLRDDLTFLRRGVKQWAAAVGVLLVLSVALGFWLLRGQRQTAREMNETQKAMGAMMTEMSKLRQGVSAFPRVEAQVREGRGSDEPANVEDSVYAELGKQLGVDPKVLREKMPQLANDLKRAPDTNSYERANAFYVSGDYTEAERLALQAADDALKAPTPKMEDAVKALKLAGLSAQRRFQRARAMEHFREADKLTDRERRPGEWADIQHAIASSMVFSGQAAKAEKLLRDVIQVRTRLLGAEHADTLTSRTRLAMALNNQGKLAVAEAEFRKCMELSEKINGREHADTLSARNGLASALDNQGKYSDAETEFRQVLNLREKMLGPEHASTLRTRMGLANTLVHQGKYAEAQEHYSEGARLSEKTGGAEHPSTLRGRAGLAEVLFHQGKYGEAEERFREIVKTRERTAGPEHPSTLVSRADLAEALLENGKLPESESEFREVIKLREKVLGADNPETLKSRATLAEALRRQGKHPEAEVECREVTKLAESTLGIEHPITIRSRFYLGNALGSRGSFAEAEAELRQVLELHEKKAGAEHPETLRTCQSLAEWLSHQGKTEEAKALALRAVEGMRKTLGAAHPMTEHADALCVRLQASR